jgi:predicted double-glycine peptidase
MPRAASIPCSAVLILAGLACLPAAAAPPGPPGVLLDVPFVAQTKNACGAAALSMVMRYWDRSLGRPDSPRDGERAIDQELDPGVQGVSNTAMAAYLEDSGYRVFAFSGRWSDLHENLAKGRPLIVGLGPEGRSKLHYVVVAGIDWQRNFVFVNDPARRKLFQMARSQFEAQWQATGNWTLLAVPR